MNFGRKSTLGVARKSTLGARRGCCCCDAINCASNPCPTIVASTTLNITLSEGAGTYTTPGCVTGYALNCGALNGDHVLTRDTFYIPPYYYILRAWTAPLGTSNGHPYVMAIWADCVSSPSAAIRWHFQCHEQFYFNSCYAGWSTFLSCRCDPAGVVIPKYAYPGGVYVPAVTINAMS
jgi:hypothetical protein